MGSEQRLELAVGLGERVERQRAVFQYRGNIVVQLRQAADADVA
jgi:hypothetical protein